MKGGKEESGTTEDAAIQSDGFRPKMSDEQSTKMYCDLLAGEWLDMSDPNYTVRIEGTVFKNYKLGELESEVDILVNKLCTNTACNPESGKYASNICMLLGSKCYVLMSSSKASFSIKDMETNTNRVYKKTAE